MAKISILAKVAAKIDAATKAQDCQWTRGYESTKAFKARIKAQKAARTAAAKARKEAANKKRRAAISAALNSVAGAEYKDFSCTIGEVLAAAGKDLKIEMKRVAKAAKAKAMKAAKAKREAAVAAARANVEALKAAKKAAAESANADSKKGLVRFDEKRTREIAIDIIKSDLEALKALERAIKWAIRQAHRTIDGLYILAADARTLGLRGKAWVALAEIDVQKDDIKAKEKALAMTRIKIAELKAIVAAAA